MHDPHAPFLVLGGFGIDSEYVPQLAAKVSEVARLYGFNLEYPNELKFQHVATQKDSERKPQWMIRAGLETLVARRALVYSCLRAAASVPTVEVLCVGVNVGRLEETQNPIQQVVTPLLERIELNCKKHNTHGLVMMDEERKDDKLLRETLRDGSPFFKYESLPDTIAFMPSQESAGIQIADLIAGGFQRYVNASDPGYLRTFLKSVDGFPENVVGKGLKLLDRADRLLLPERRTVNWSEFDRAIHTYEMEVHQPSKKLSWRADGAPNLLFENDWDTDWDTAVKK
ncbi:DUF3800 domain-containing protein [Corynebacterium sp. HMSC29G08]|uniref:DUF3800 domain-containing protein n=1 Tax=Corynebacterium sp. HMSC29G08 TaxID=1581069 RepID=UPI0008A3FC9F|nr:DUF3800 domain-containing protein [Corynebacterium sp. HMSC29G08]OFT82147.1 hypothetical protein HMPREF3101_08485 [Corynebacterium sp. HMSC29G08]